MKLLISFVSWFVLMTVWSGCGKSVEDAEQLSRVVVRKLPLQLWYQSPAREWQTEALPIGNGRLGAMIFGGVENDRIVLNEESIIAGPPIPEKRVGAYKYIEQARVAYFAGEYADCQRIMQEQRYLFAHWSLLRPTVGR